MNTLTSTTVPSIEVEAYKDLLITCPAFSPKIALNSLSSGVGLISPLGETFPTIIIPGLIYVPTLMIPEPSK